jgi:hypothetical protein
MPGRPPHRSLCALVLSVKDQSADTPGRWVAPVRDPGGTAGWWPGYGRRCFVDRNWAQARPFGSDPPASNKTGQQKKGNQVKRIAVGLVIGLILGAVGTAGATIALSSPTYKACATSSHVLAVAVAGKCPKGTSVVSIAAQGTPGKQGVQGKAGPAGPKGLTGKSPWESGSVTLNNKCPTGLTCTGVFTASKPIGPVLTILSTQYIVELTQTPHSSPVSCEIGVAGGPVYWQGAMNGSASMAFVDTPGDGRPFVHCTSTSNGGAWIVTVTFWYQVIG